MSEEDLPMTHLDFSNIICPEHEHDYNTIVIFINKTGLYCGRCGKRLEYET